MSGSIDINESSTWMPAGWVLDNVLARISEQLMAEHPALAALVLEGQTERSGGFLDLRSLLPEDFRRLTHAAVTVLGQAESRGSADFAQPEFFAGYLEQFRRLVTLLRADPRAALH